MREMMEKVSKKQNSIFGNWETRVGFAILPFGWLET